MRFATNFTRGLIARTIGGIDAEAYAARRWGPHSGALIKSALGATTSADDISTGGAGNDEFFASIEEASLIGRLQGLRRVPFNTRLLSMGGGATGFWVAQHNPIPLSRVSLQGSSLPRLKVGAIVAVTREGLESASPLAETRFEADLRRALVTALDSAFVDATNSGIAGETPASVCAIGSSAIPSAGTAAEDIAALISDFNADLSQAFYICSPTLAAQIAMSRDLAGSFAFPDIGPRGGSLLGVPVLTSKGCPDDQLVLLDPSAVAAALDSVSIARSTATSLVMSDDPTASGEAGEFVSLFQTDTVGLKAVISANWERQHVAAVSVVTGASYGVTAS